MTGLILTESQHYLVRALEFGEPAKWYVYCLADLWRMVELSGGELGYWIELVSYSQFPCQICNTKYTPPPGIRPPFRMREVIYQIKASYPDYDLTA